MVIVIVTDFLAFVLMHTQKNESQEYQLFGREFWRKIGVCVYTFLYVEKPNPNDLELFEEAFKEVDYINQTSERFAYRTQNAPTTTVNKFDNIDYNKGKSNNKKSDEPTGYCIRTGVEIPFNVEKPMSYEAFKVWSQYGDTNYPEKFCHFSGEPSNGETSVSKPILKKNWKKAKEIFDF